MLVSIRQCLVVGRLHAATACNGHRLFSCRGSSSPHVLASVPWQLTLPTETTGPSHQQHSNPKGSELVNPYSRLHSSWWCVTSHQGLQCRQLLTTTLTTVIDNNNNDIRSRILPAVRSDMVISSLNNHSRYRPVPAATLTTIRYKTNEENMRLLSMRKLETVIGNNSSKTHLSTPPRYETDINQDRHLSGIRQYTNRILPAKERDTGNCTISKRHFSTTTARGSISNSTACRSVEDVAGIISKERSKVMVMTGAGLSTASGIPDFRSPGTGLYSNLQKYNLPYPEAIFDINYFVMDSRPFITLARELYPGVQYRPNAAHYFLRLLQEKERLLKVYTQNIDGLETLSGVSKSLLVEAHGSFSTASCITCRAVHDADDVRHSILHGDGAPCCSVQHCQGIVKPDIVFFGENLPEAFWKYEEDLQTCDLLLIMGTSLEVYPFAGIADAAPHSTPRVLLNNTVAGELGSRPLDCLLLGDIVSTVSKLSDSCGWLDQLKQLVQEDQ